MFRKKLALILTISLSFAASGCGGNNTDSKTDDISKGRYAEEEISLSEVPSICGEFFNQKGKSVFYDYYNSKLYTQDKETDTFTAADFPSLAELGDDVTADSITALPDGSFVLVYYLPDEKESKPDSIVYKEHYAYMSAEGKLKELDLDLRYSEIDAFECTDDGRVFAISYEGNVYEINIDEESVKMLFNIGGQPRAFDIVSDYIICADSRKLYFYNIADGKMMETPQVLGDFWKDQNLSTEGLTALDPVCDFCAGKDNSIYIITEKGLYRYIVNGNQVEQILDGMAYHIGSPSCSVRSVLAESEQSFLVTYKEGRVMRYRYDPSAPNNISSSLSIYSLTQNDTLEQAISEFKIQNPNVDTKYETGIEKNSSITYEDAIKNLNTQICSDEAPDILMLDGMDISNLIDKDLLADLNKYEKTIDPDGLLLDNIAKNYKNDGLYTMTCKFELPVITARKDNLDKINSFSSFADMVVNQHTIITNRPVAQFFTPQEVIETALEFTADEIMTDDGVNTKNLTQMLDDCIKIYKSERAVLTDNDVENHIYNKECSSSPIDKWGYDITGRSMQLINNDEMLAMGAADGFVNCLNVITSLNNEDPDIAYRYGFTEDSSIYVPRCILGMCSAGKNKDNAAKFLDTAFSQSVQDIELYDGLPVNRNSLKYFYGKNKSDKGKGFALGDHFGGKSARMWAGWIDSTESAKLDSALQKLDTPEYVETMTKDVIIDTGTKCLDENMTVDDAVKEITEKINLKIQE